MAGDDLKAKIATALRKAYFQDAGDYIDVSDGDEDNVQVLIISRRLGGKRAKEKRDLIWGVLLAELKPDEWQRISLLVARTPEEVLAG